MSTQDKSRSPSLEEVLNTAIEYHTADIWTALPGSIDSYDPIDQKADIKPLITSLSETAEGDELAENLPVLPNVPIIFPRGGEFFLSFPLKPGDHVLLIFVFFPRSQPATTAARAREENEDQICRGRRLLQGSKGCLRRRYSRTRLVLRHRGATAVSTQDKSRSPSLEEVLNTAIEYHTADIWTALPGSIDSYDPIDQKADIKPLITSLSETAEGDELAENLPVLPNVPIIFPRGGEFFLSFPLKPGDHVLLIFNSRSIDKFVTGDGEVTNPDDYLRHDLSSAVAYAGFYPYQKALAVEDASSDTMAFGKEGGPTVHISKSKIDLGEKNPSDKASLDSKVQDEIKALRDAVNNFVTTFNTHSHVTTATVLLDGPGTITPPTSPATAPAAVGSTASALVRMKE